MAKIGKDVIEYIVVVLKEKEIELGSPLQAHYELYKSNGVSLTRFMWDLYYLARDHAVKVEGHSDLVMGSEDSASWVSESKFIVDGEVFDSHIETAMRSVIKSLNITL